MSQFKLSLSDVKVPVAEYPGLGNLKRIMDRNINSFRDFYSMGNRVVKNQHPLVQYLLQLSINTEWEPSYLLNYLLLNHKKVASMVGFTSIYNRGKDFAEWFYPESNHRTLVVVPFDTSWSENVNIPEFVHPGGLTPIMTTSETHYWNIDHLLDSVPRTLEDQTFTVLELDVFGFVFGYYFYLKDRLDRDINVGLSPHHYVTLVLMDLYPQHNELVNINCLFSATEPEVQKSGFALEPYIPQLSKYIHWGRKLLMRERIKTFAEFLNIFKPVSCWGRDEWLTHEVPKTMMLAQLAWVYTLSSFHWCYIYLWFMAFVGNEDPIVESRLKTFFKIPVNYNANQIKDPNWQSFYINCWNDLKAR